MSRDHRTFRNAAPFAESDSLAPFNQPDEHAGHSPFINLYPSDPTQGDYEASGSGAFRADTPPPPLPDLPDLLVPDESAKSALSSAGQGKNTSNRTKRARMTGSTKGKGRASEDISEVGTPTVGEYGDEGSEREGSPDGTAQPTKKVRRVRKPRVTKRTTIMPELPTLFRDGGAQADGAMEDVGVQQRRTAELARARDPWVMRDAL